MDISLDFMGIFELIYVECLEQSLALKEPYINVYSCCYKRVCGRGQGGDEGKVESERPKVSQVPFTGT